MTAWRRTELDKVATADELQIVPPALAAHFENRRQSESSASPTTFTSALPMGAAPAWFRGAKLRHEARIRAGGIEKDVMLLEADPNLNDEIDAAYRAKHCAGRVVP
jgi:hypothetical protein